jgi:hypothetical protein
LHLENKRDKTRIVGELEDTVNELRIAELQFRLACTVNIAVGNQTQNLDTPLEWTFGQHRVTHDEFGLRFDQAEFAASQLEMTTTMILAGAIREAIVSQFHDPKCHENDDVKSSYQISRMIKNAFSHNLLRPTWSIDSDCKDKTFAIEGVITFNTENIHGRFVTWQDYGGPLAMFRLSRFVREVLLQSPIDPTRAKPSPPSQKCISKEG